MIKKSGQTVGFLIGLLVSVVYWAFLIGGQTMGIRLSLSPFWSMWTANVLALAIGFILTIVRVTR
jgi:lipopolysaccharide export system permease protein